MSTPEENLQRLQKAREQEAALVIRLQDCLNDLGNVIGTKLSELDEIEIEDLPVRMLPQLLKSFIDGLTVLQASHDRISGYGVLMKELEAILEGGNTKANNH